MIAQPTSLQDRINNVVSRIKILFKERQKSMSKGQRRAFRIILNHFDVLRDESERTQELYLATVLHMSREGFYQFISDCNQKDTIGRAIAKHNLKVEKELTSSGINFQQWLSYNGEETEEVANHKKNGELWLELDKLLKDLQSCFTCTELEDSIRKDIINLQKRKVDIQQGRLKVSNKNYFTSLFPVYKKSVEYLNKKKKDVIVDLTHKIIFHQVGHILRMFSGQAKYKYSVQLWGRIPFRDIFQGNDSACCLSIGDAFIYPAVKLPGVDCKQYPAGVSDYLIDKGVQVAEVIEEDWGRIGQCWLFLSRDGNGQADLIADSFDLNGYRVISKSQKSAIRSCMFRFLQNYAHACGAQRAFLGKTGPLLKNGKIHKIRNDVKVKDLPVVTMNPIKKMGGYFLNSPYFLESRGGTEAYDISSFSKGPD